MTRTSLIPLLDDFDRAFNLVPFPLSEKGWSSYFPRLDLAESESEVRVTAELPGMDEKDIDISLSDNTLTISGEKKAEHEEKNGNFYRTERSFGSCTRTVDLPAEVNEDKVEASFKRGVLTITLPKSEKAKKTTNKIQVKGE